MAKAKTSNDNFEAILRRELRDAPVASTAECIGPEVLAAYYDRTMSQGERNGVELHLESCARCQSMMASIGRADDSDVERPREREETARGFFWLSRVVAPITMLGIVIAIAIGIRTREQPNQPEAIALASKSVPPRLELPEPAPVAPAFKAEQLRPKGPSISNPPVAGTSGDTLNQTASEEYRSQAPNAPAPIPEAKVASAFPQYRMQMQSRAGASGSMAMTAKAAAINIVHSPDRSVAWRFGKAGTIARWTSSTGWLTQRAGVTTDLLAAASPSNDVCWMAGKSGTIIRTLDGGAHWQLVSPPSRRNFTAITATDSNNATVEAHGARSSTRDGGVTWSSP